MNTVIIVSAAGYGNFGDDLINADWCDYYKNYNKILICGPGKISTDFERRLSLEDIDKIYYDDISELVISRKNNLVIHITGGGFCNDKFDVAKKIFNFLIRFQDKAIVIATGISFFPLNSDTLDLLSRVRFRYASFRDTHYIKYVNANFKLVLGDDMINRIGPGGEADIKKAVNNIYINIQNQFDIPANLLEIAKKIKLHIDKFKYERVIFCELCPGDLDIVEYFNDFEIIARSEFCYSGWVQAAGGKFIGSRFHFRMAMEAVGARGVVVLADNEYYANKHENTGPPINFRPGFSTVMNIDDFINTDWNMPDGNYKNLHFRRKKSEKNIIGLMLNVPLIDFRF